jgi:hypothetical protein
MRPSTKLHQRKHNLPPLRAQIQVRMKVKKRSQKLPGNCPRQLLRRHLTFVETSRSQSLRCRICSISCLFAICWVHNRHIDTHPHLGIGGTYPPIMDLGYKCPSRSSKQSQTSITTPHDLVLSTRPSCSTCSRSAVSLTKPQTSL